MAVLQRFMPVRDPARLDLAQNPGRPASVSTLRVTDKDIAMKLRLRPCTGGAVQQRDRVRPEIGLQRSEDRLIAGDTGAC
jgi:hypothetical protein